MTENVAADGSTKGVYRAVDDCEWSLAWEGGVA